MSATPAESLTTAVAITWGLPRNFRSIQARPAQGRTCEARHYTESP